MSGDCRARVNMNGRLRAVTYGRPCAAHIDPIEKKPLFHFRPGTKVLSIATAGCNLHCKNCQNWRISQSKPDEVESFALEPVQLIQAARNYRCPSIAYTYTEPIIYYEYVLDSAERARAARIENVLVTAGYILPEPFRRLGKFIDASNTDLKSFDDRFYRDICGATLKPVLDTLVLTRELGIWLEVTNLIVPTLSDDLLMIRKMCQWIRRWLGDTTPLHFSRFHPQYKLQELPPTPVEVLENARKEALDCGLKHVYIGNVLGHEGEATYCESCGKELIRRVGYRIGEPRLKDGRCKFCGAPVAGRW